MSFDHSYFSEYYEDLKQRLAANQLQSLDPY